ncbi:hypothetical protein NL298_27010, partial [Klebsiella pneumoniae]|nr:hypothetical protein [Klebsiella pneumoniae]
MSDLVNTNLPKLKTELSAEKDERLKLDLWSRKWNLVIKGIEGRSREEVHVTDKLVRQAFIARLKLPTRDVDDMLFQ